MLFPQHPPEKIPCLCFLLLQAFHLYLVAHADENPRVGVAAYARVPVLFFNDDLGSLVAFLFRLVISVTYADQLIAVFLKPGAGAVNAG